MKRFVIGLLLAVGMRCAAQEISPVTFQQKRFTVFRVELARQSLQLFWRDDAGVPLKSFETLDRWLRGRGRKLTFAMNAGMYHGDFSPVGLYVEDKRDLRPLNLTKGEGNFFLQPNGVFAVTRSGAQVVESSTYPVIQRTAFLATQSGPMLVIDGRIHPAFRRDSKSRLFRNGVGVVSPEQVVFAISEEPVTLYEFAQLFRDKLHCRDALFLDGTISSVYSSELKRNDRKMDLGPIIGITEPLGRADEKP